MPASLGSANQESEMKIFEKKEMPLKSRHPYRAKVISKQDFPKSSQNSRTHTLPKVSTIF